MPFDDILTDTSDLLSQRLLAAGYTLEPDYYPNTKMVIANTVKFGDLAISYRVEPNHQVFITYMESLTKTDDDGSADTIKKGLSQTVKGLSRFADYLVSEVPEMLRVRGLMRAVSDHAWLRPKNQVQEVTTERLVDYAIKHFGIQVTSVEDNGGVWIECDLQALRQRKQVRKSPKTGRQG